MRKHAVLIALLFVVALTVASGVVQGRLRNRWGQSEAMQAAAASLQTMPETIGPWKMQSAEKLDQPTINMLECAGNVVRRYVNEETGETVSVTVIVGPAGPIAVHTPEICMSSRAYKRSEDRRVVVVKDPAGKEQRFWSLAFKATDLSGAVLRVMYAWNDGAGWQAPEDARFAFAGRPYLYKVQLAADVRPGADPSSPDACRKFLEDIVAGEGNWLAQPSPKD